MAGITSARESDRDEQTAAFQASSGSRLWFAPPEDRRVLLQTIIEVAPKELIEIEFKVVGNATGEAKRDEQSLLLSVCWLDRTRSLLDRVSKGFVKSSTYGNFKYIGYSPTGNTPEDDSDRIVEVVLTPPQSSFMMARVLSFSNWGLSLSELRVRRPEMMSGATGE